MWGRCSATASLATSVFPFLRPGQVDPGRQGGITAPWASPFNLLSRWSDGPPEAALKTHHVELQHRNFGEFKVPSLRNVANTAPYMHDGQIATLRDVVRHYSELNMERLHADGESILQPFRDSRPAKAPIWQTFSSHLVGPGCAEMEAGKTGTLPTRQHSCKVHRTLGDLQAVQWPGLAQKTCPVQASAVANKLKARQSPFAARVLHRPGLPGKIGLLCGCRNWHQTGQWPVVPQVHPPCGRINQSVAGSQPL